MLQAKVLDQALAKKNKEIDELNKKNEDTKREYEAKVKNLMHSIGALQKQADDLEAKSHENVRVEIIKKLKAERKDQEQVINLLRKFIGRDVEVDKYLIKEFKKSGEQRLLSYEELKIRNKNLENELKKVRLGSGGAHLHDKEKGKKAKISDAELQVLVVQKFKAQLDEYDHKISNLESENLQLKNSKQKMEEIQEQLYSKIKNYNKEVNEMKSVYDLIKKEVQEDSLQKLNDANLKVAKANQENEKLKLKIKEIIEIQDEQKENESNKLNKVLKDNQIYEKLLLTKKDELKVYQDELNNFRGEIDKLDAKGIFKIKKLENENQMIFKSKQELEADVNYLNLRLQQKDSHINNLKGTIEELEKQLKVREQEISMLNDKISEFQNIIESRENSFLSKF